MIGRALKLLRVFHNLKQKELASRLGLSPSYVCEIESEKKEVTVDTLQMYASCFKIPVSSLLYFAEHIDSRGELHPVSPVAAKTLQMLDWLNTITSDDDERDEEISA
jgi:transcriptional regulator with XRE-family HTH domain